ncbi:MAG: amino acid adenylation domain-containing protein, partial [Limisphaerales bacterium]
MRAPPVQGEVPRSRVERLRPRGFSRQEQSVVGRFEAQVKATPDAVAVVFGARSLSYRQLNARANHLAWRLRRFVTAPEPLIGICAERSLEMLIGLLAILKAGGAYVPLDPDHPRERLAFILEDCQVPVLLTQRGLTERLPKPPPARLLLDALTGEEPVNPPLRSDADSLAYVMYTSGSTGRAKGTLIPHRGVVRLVKDTDYATFGPDEVFLQLASLSFDASTFEIWGPLLNGGCLVIMPPGPPSLGQIGEAIRQHGVTTLWLTAGLFHLMVDHAVEKLRPLRQLLAGGDVLSVAHVRRALQALPGVRLVNGYGPTENTTFTCCYSIPANLGPVERIPIGKAIARTEVHVLDENQQPVPPGVEGELCVGGDGLARGYLNQPELTAERFVTVPWMSGPAARLYRTGDRACRRPDGTYDFLGRQDQQVKLRGFRIEPGEIEAALGRCPDVREAAVVVREEADGDKQLVAWVVPRNGNTPAIEALRRRLAGILPDHLVPSAFGFIEALPLTPNGKVDRRALQRRRPAAPGTPASQAIPLTATQMELAADWRTLLTVDEVAPGTHFFDLGGHSLLAMRLTARIRERWGVELSLPDLFAAPTLEGMAARIESRLRSSPAPLRDFPKITDPTPLPSCEQERMYFLRQWCPAAALYNEPLALRGRGPIDAEALRHCLEILEHRHEPLRTTFVVVDGVLRQRINPCRELTLAVEDLSHLPPDQKEEALKAGCEREATDPFDLEAGPVWRQRLFLLGNEEHVMLLTWHHVCVDEWSIGIFLDELRTLYRSDVNARAQRLPPLGACYSGYAAWQREWLRSEAAEAQLAYWRRQLAGPLPELVLPIARPQPEVPGFHGATERLVLTSFSVERVRALEREGHCTEFTVLLAALFAWLHQVSGQTDLLIGTPISTRTRPETQSLVGLFLNTLPIRADLGGNPTFREVIRRVRQVAMESYSHRDLPFDRLVEALSSARNGRPSPLVQIAFVRLSGLGSESGVGSWDASPLPVHTGTAKFDLTLFLADQPEGLTATLEYRTDLFEAAGIQGMLRGFEALLTTLLARPDTALSELDPALDAGLPV